MFSELGICGTAWLGLPVEQWEDDDEFKKLQDFSRCLKVTNDVAERGVKMIQDFINTVTNDEEQLQGVMQLVETHRKQIPDFKKTTLMTL